MKLAFTIYLCVALSSFASPNETNRISVIPGSGVDGVVEIGMNRSEAMAVLKEYTFTETIDYYYSPYAHDTNISHSITYHDLGVTAEFNSHSKKVVRINISSPPARSKFENVHIDLLGSDFDWNKPITEDEITDKLGELNIVYGEESIQSRLNQIDHLAIPNKGKSYRVFLYFSKGILFVFNHGDLTLISIYKEKTRDPNQILDPTWTTPVLKATSDSQAGQD